MAHGGFAPFPRRHSGGSTVYGESAANYARQVADNVALKRTRKLCVFTFTTDGATASVSVYIGLNGNGLAHQLDTIVANGTGDTSLSWTDIRSFVDDYEIVHSLKPRAAIGTVQGATYAKSVFELLDTGVRVRTFNAAGAAVNADVTVTLWGSESAKISDYDGALDKTDSETEGDTPYAWIWYRDYTAMIGSLPTASTSTIVHAQKLALARHEAAKTRAVERAIANSLPATADEAIYAWAEVLKVPVGPNDRRHDIRVNCAAKFAATRGPTMTATDAALEQLLGSMFVQTHRTIGASLSVPPTQTFWPGGTPGDPAASLGGATWQSERAHLAVQLIYPQAGDVEEFLRKANVTLFQHMDRVLPIWATYNWASWSGDTLGFYLDGVNDSHLDFTGLTPS
jgi:hypothetical protein